MKMTKMKYFKIEFHVGWVHTTTLFFVEKVTCVSYFSHSILYCKHYFGIFPQVHCIILGKIYRNHKRFDYKFPYIFFLPFFVAHSGQKFSIHNDRRKSIVLARLGKSTKMFKNEANVCSPRTPKLEFRISNAEQIKSYYFNSIAQFRLVCRTVLILTLLNYYYPSQMVSLMCYFVHIFSRTHRHTHAHQNQCRRQSEKKAHNWLVKMLRNEWATTLNSISELILFSFYFSFSSSCSLFHLPPYRFNTLYTRLGSWDTHMIHDVSDIWFVHSRTHFSGLSRTPWLSKILPNGVFDNPYSHFWFKSV